MLNRPQQENALSAIVWAAVLALLFFIGQTLVQDDSHLACPVDDCSAVATESMD